jgi:hypothetical protein
MRRGGGLAVAQALGRGDGGRRGGGGGRPAAWRVGQALDLLCRGVRLG